MAKMTELANFTNPHAHGGMSIDKGTTTVWVFGHVGIWAEWIID
jgi:hypothetical protein